MIEVNIKPEDIDKMLSDAILKSAIGSDIIKATKSVLASTSYGNKSIVEVSVESFVRDYITNLLRDENSDVGTALRIAVKEKLDAFLQTEAAAATIEKIIDKITRNSY